MHQKEAVGVALENTMSLKMVPLLNFSSQKENRTVADIFNEKSFL